MRWIKSLLILFMLLTAIYFLGPKPSHPVYSLILPTFPPIDSSLENIIATRESFHHLKPNNEARIVWANDSLKQPTEYAIVYLHGFSASQEEGNPVHRDIARKFGCNLYLSRLSEHGIDTVDALYHFTAESLWTSAKEAYAIGKRLGKKVILMGTSTGGSVAIQLASAYPEIAGLVLYSPNIAINDPNAWLLNNPWGLQIARLVKQSNLNTAKNNTDIYKQYWNRQYRLEATVQLEEYLETAMTRETFSRITQPTLTLFYYKDEQHQDNVVKVSAMKKMVSELGTAAALKKMVAIPDAGSHVLASPIQSKDIPSVEMETIHFLNGTLHMPFRQ